MRSTSQVSSNILFQRQKFLIVCSVFTIVIIGLSIANIYDHGFNYFNSLLPLFTIVFSVYAYWDQLQPLMVLKRIRDTLNEAKKVMFISVLPIPKGWEKSDMWHGH